ncbi:adhesion G protein-coupled receptor E4-like [Clupea harengus]|uniref:Adhesion G protein-coupled receptor E4-like n=1 Tax=Clupea harengus TaxID=7950 RepID=A0A8M1KAJ8_CLUHA|nr:adhesion G protein-coupled receptor E4-like [Clupea harengus]
MLFKIMVQFVILGCPWALGLFVDHGKVLEVLFLFLTSQQGTAIFLVHCVLNIEVRRQYRVWWKRFGPSSKQADSSTGTGATLSTSQPAVPLTPVESRDSGNKRDVARQMGNENKRD